MTLVEFLLARIAEDEEAANETGWLALEYGVDSYGREAFARRVLAECEAKRRIVEEHPLDEDGYCYDSVTHSRGCKWLWPCPTIRAIAAVYADHPDYDEGWKL